MLRRRLLSALGALGLGEPAVVMAQAAGGGSNGARNERLNGAALMSVTIPLEIDPGGHVFIKVEILGQTVDAVVDSGARRSAIDKTFAKSLGLEPTLSTKAAGMTSDLEIQRVNLREIMVGDRPITFDGVLAVDLTSISATLGRSIRIIMGQDCFSGAALTLNFDAMTMKLGPARAPSEPGFVISHLRLTAHGRLYTTVSVEGHAPVEALYDLGSNVPVYVSPTYAKQIGLFANRKVSKAASFGAEGMSIDDVATARSITLAGRKLANVPVQSPTQWNQVAPIVIGAPVWRRFVNVLDLDRATLWLKPNRLGFDQPFSKDRSGLGAQRLSDRLRILFVAPVSPAERAGLHVGDEIISIDGEPVGPTLYLKRPRPGAEPAGTMLQLQLASGPQTALMLADYF